MLKYTFSIPAVIGMIVACFFILSGFAGISAQEQDNPAAPEQSTTQPQDDSESPAQPSAEPQEDPTPPAQPQAQSTTQPQEDPEPAVTPPAKRESLGDPAFEASIEASLDVMEWKIEGKEILTVHNRTEKSTEEIVLLCIPNAFANKETLREAGLTLEACNTAGDDILPHLGYIDLKGVRLTKPEGHSVEPTLAGTLLRLPLPFPLEPDASVSLTLDFMVKLPDRSLGWAGRKGRHVDATMWFPKPALLTDDGWIAGQGCHPALGDVKVTLSLPSTFTIDAGGRLVESHVENALKTVRFDAHMVHDLAWTADPISVPETNIYEGVEIVLHRQPFMENQAQALLGAAKACLDYSNRFLAPYPYERLVISTTPYGLGDCVGSSMFISIGQGFPTHLKALGENAKEPALELIRSWTQAYFHGILMDRPGAEVPLCEGLARYCFLKIAESHFLSHDSASAIESLDQRVVNHLMDFGFGLYNAEDTIDSEGICCSRLKPYYDYANLTSLVGYRKSPFHDDPITTTMLGYRVGAMSRGKTGQQWTASLKEQSALARSPGSADRQKAGAARGAGVALGLIAIERRLGESRMKEMVKGFVNQHRFQRPGMSDFLACVQQAAGEQEASLAALLLHPECTIDVAVQTATCRPADLPHGYIPQATLRDSVHENPVPEPTDEEGVCFGVGDLIQWKCATENETPADTGGAPVLIPPDWQWEVEVTNFGEACVPVTVELLFEGGRTETMDWDGVGKARSFQGRSTEKLICATIDPDSIYAMDHNVLNNARSVDYKEQGTLFLAAWVQFWTQNYLNGWAILN